MQSTKYLKNGFEERNGIYNRKTPQYWNRWNFRNFTKINFHSLKVWLSNRWQINKIRIIHARESNTTRKTHLLTGLDNVNGVGTPNALIFILCCIVGDGRWPPKLSGVPPLVCSTPLGWGCGLHLEWYCWIRTGTCCRGELSPPSIGGRKKLFFEPCRWRGGVGSQSWDWDADGSMSGSEPSRPGES